jgi:hypothetical protein
MNQAKKLTAQESGLEHDCRRTQGTEPTEVAGSIVEDQKLPKVAVMRDDVTTQQYLLNHNF